MLFLYRIQNDASESATFNACETRGNTLEDLVRSLQDIFGVDFRESFSWRLRKSDGDFGYVWRDVGPKDFAQPLDGDASMVKLLRLSSLRYSAERLPLRLIGQSGDLGLGRKVTTEPVRKRGQDAIIEPTNKVSSKQPIPDDTENEDSFDAVFEPPKQTVTAFNPPVSTPSDDEMEGLSAEERANIRIEERERAERAERDRKVQEVRDADTAAQANADARSLAWHELKSKLENWSGTEKNRKPIRALLSTMHNVLWEGAKWTPTSILVRPNEVRLAFRKAMLVVHPDKIASGSSPHVQVIAKYCFENLNAAFEVFEATELRGTS